MPEPRAAARGYVRDLVSVVIPFANPNEDYLREAVASVVSQKYEHWEIVLVDDGNDSLGGDLARAIVAPLGDRARVVTYDVRGNRGISAARNEGIRHARGEFVAFLDADDIYLPDMLGVALGALRANPSAMLVCSNTRYWYSWNTRNHGTDFVPDAGEAGVYTPPDLLGRWLKGEIAVPPPCGFTVRRETIDAVGGFEDAFGGLYEDQVFLAKVGLTSIVVVVDDIVACYRQHPASMCALVTGESARSGREVFLRWLEDYIGKIGVSSSEMHKVIQGELWKVTHPRLAKARRLVVKAMSQLTA